MICGSKQAKSKLIVEYDSLDFSKCFDKLVASIFTKEARTETLEQCHKVHVVELFCITPATVVVLGVRLVVYLL